MADDNSLRSYRTNDPHRRAPSEQRDPIAGSDPLAELARLIGQPDPLAVQPAHPKPRQHLEPRQQFAEDDWRRHVERQHVERQHVERPAYETMADPEPVQQDAYSMASVPQDAEMRYSDNGYAGPRDYGRDNAVYPAEPQHHYPADQYPADQYAGYDDQHRAQGDQRPHEAAELSEQDIYDDPPRRKRSNSLVTALVLVCCAVLGTAGAYAYRSYSTGSGAAPGQAPVIVADRAPNKVVPAAPTDGQPARSQDRVPSGSNERLVSREEQPVALAPNPRTALPSPAQPTTTGSTPPSSATAPWPASPPAAPESAPAASASASSQSEPKRVRTVVIRSEDGGADTRSGANARQPAARQQGGRNAPLSLDPQDPSEAPTAELPRSQRPATSPAPRAEPSQRVASAPSNGGSGGYVVQVSSQRSEADAQASFRGLAAKYPQLRNRQPIIRRADLGSKGTFYRAMVGPFGSSGEANEFCGSLKAAGGQCLIQRN